jgi:Membrane domain of glycerophosphoryl diester phosphodiesterase
MTVAEASRARFDSNRVFSRTFGLARRNFVSFGLLALIFNGVPWLVFVQFGPSFFARSGASEPTTNLVYFLVAFLSGTVLQGVLTLAAIEDLSGRPVSPGVALSVSLARVPQLLGAGILVMAGVIAGAMVFFIPGIMLAARWFVTTPVIVSENQGVFAAMGRSAHLTKGYRWHIFGLGLIYFIAVFVLTIVIKTIFDALSWNAAGGLAVVEFLRSLTSMLFELVKSVIATLGIAAVYFELRQIKDGVGVSEIAAVFD